MKISINQSCIRCEKCVDICVAHIFSQKKEEIVAENIDKCVVCGHCVAVCPSDAINHSCFPASSIHSVDRLLFPTPEQMDLIIKTRRSNRAFTTEPIPKAYLDKIVEAAYRSPTASNEQELSFTIVTNPQKLHQISALTLDVFTSILKKIKIVKPIIKLFMPNVVKQIPTFLDLIDKFKNGDDRILRNATAVIFIHTPEKARFGRQDANLAYQNASLMAESLGVAHFYTGFVCSGVDHDKKKRLEKALGIKGKIHAGMALGMPSFKFDKYIDKKPMQANWI